ncbi:MAG: hypothetical protein GF330_09520 [Candidatus Eisenbacteria bacterium]|nr:hypothetical protein [Candidatus Eisenbacteria bacterium]
MIVARGGCLIRECLWRWKLENLKRALRRPLQPLVRGLDALGCRPDYLTLAGVLAALLSGIALASGNRTLGVFWLLVSLLCDLLDGDLARRSGSGQSRFGAFLDSTADRISETFFLGGLLIGRYELLSLTWGWILLWVLALSGGYMVSYARARAEGLGLACSVGWGDRASRMLVLILLLIFGYRASGWFLLAMALLAWFTVYQRVSLVWRETRTPPASAAASPGATAGTGEGGEAV